MTAVDVVIVTRNRPGQVEACVRSVLASTATDFSILVSDQSDDSDTRSIVDALGKDDPRVRYLATASRGSSRSRNAAIAVTDAPLVLFTDDDVRVAADWVERMVEEFDRTPDAAAVFGRLGATDEGAPADAARAAWFGVAQTHAEERRVFVDDPTDLGFGHGANMGFRRTALEAVGGFDPLLGVGGELRSWPERDIGYRLLVAGWSIVFQPDVRALHHQWRTWDEVFAQHRNYAFGAGAACRKYMACGQPSARRLLASWMAQLGVRQIVSGLLRWRDFRKVRLGGIAIGWAFRGLIASRRYDIDHETVRYRDPFD